MKRRVKFFACCAVCVCALPAWSQSAVPARESIEWSAALAWGSGKLLNTERLPNGAVFNQERGSVRDQRLSLGAARGVWSLSWGLRQASGLLAYEGFNQLALPIATQTEMRVDAQSLRAAWRAPTHSAWGLAWTPQLGLGLHSERWDRRIRATALSTPLREVYRAQALGPALALEVTRSSVDPAWTAHVRWDAARAQTSRLLVDPYGAFESTSLHPAKRWQHEAAIGAEFRLPTGWAQAVGTRRVALTMDAQTRGLQPGPSQKTQLRRNGVAVSQIEFPGARWRHGSLAVGFRTVW